MLSFEDSYVSSEYKLNLLIWQIWFGKMNHCGLVGNTHIEEHRGSRFDSSERLHCGVHDH